MAHFIAGDSGDIFEFNVCGNLSKVCNGRSNVAACLRRSDQKEYVLGRWFYYYSPLSRANKINSNLKSSPLFYYFLHKCLGVQHQLNYHNGEMYFNFSNGEPCPSGKSSDGLYHLHVFLACDYILDTQQARITSYVSWTNQYKEEKKKKIYEE